MSARLRRLLCTAVAVVMISVYVLHRHANANASLGSLGIEHYDGGHDYRQGPHRDMPRKERRRVHANDHSHAQARNISSSEKDPSSPMAINDPTELEVLQRGPSRRPGYVANSKSTYFGYVMRDLAARLLNRHGSMVEEDEDEPSNVLVVSKDLGPSQSLSELDEVRTNASIGPSFVRYATDEGHRVHSIAGNPSADVMFSELTKWWDAQKSSASGPPRSVLLAVFDPPVGSENVLATDIASSILSKVTFKYIVFRISATIVRGATTRGDVTVANGLESIITLSEMDFKVSLLSSSHSLKLYSPNALVGFDRDGASAFFQHGAETAAVGDGTFTAYLFATKGLDLAIPSARTYFATLGAGKPKVDKDTGDCYIFVKSCKAAARLQFTSEADQSRAVGLSEINDKGSTVSAKEFLNSVNVYCGDAIVSDPERLDRFWISGPSVALSEAVCAHIRGCGGRRGASACATRIIPAINVDGRRWDKPNNGALGPSNLMVLEIDTISRSLFNQMLPKTRAFLDDAGFVSLDRYTPVALAREANHAALFAGQHMPSQNGRDERWMWDDLRHRGYAIFKGTDACVREDDPNPSILANSTHGSALHEMNCFDFERPNCIAGKAAAMRLVEHAAQFIDAYEQGKGRPWAALLSFSDTQEDTNVLSAALDDPLKSLLGTWRDLNSSEFDNALVVVVSQRGLSHGSYFQTLQGRQDGASPILFMKPPSKWTSMGPGGALQANADLWTTPLDAYATMRHLLFGERMGSTNHGSKVDARGTSLMRPLSGARKRCHGAKTIPRYLCDILEQNEAKVEGAVSGDVVEMKSPASMLSYYADIPSIQKEKRAVCVERDALSEKELYDNSFAIPCNCSTSHRNWYECSHHPWKGSGRAVEAPHEYFAFVDCPNRTLSFETRVERDPAILHRSQQQRREKKHNALPPNILFIEVDSASIAYADRHFSLTREFLSGHRIKRNEQGELTCNSGLCAVDLSQRFSVTGPNSISNQVSALSGCLTSHPDEECKGTTVDGFCNDPDAMEFHLYHHITFRNASIWCPSSSSTDHSPSPFLFDIARDLGYVSLFGEEFCFNESPFVTQGNIFELNTDIEVHRAHCRIAERYLSSKDNDPITPKMLWSGDSGFHLPCVDGDAGVEKSLIPFASILKMWESYRDIPRFAFLNAMAAHDYAARWEAMPLNAEVYDRNLLGFLTEMKARPDASNTIIILRSDHGLQDGPSIADFSTQVEHSRPWTEIVVPESLSGISLEALKTNQERMASGFDIYKTLRGLMSTSSENAKLPAIPYWSINLLTTEIPLHRTCAEGKIPREFCRNENEKTYIAPSFGTCNKFDERLQFFCPKKAKDGRIRVRVEYSVGGQQNKRPKQVNKRGKAQQKRMKRAKRTKRQNPTNAELTTERGTAASQKLTTERGTAASQKLLGGLPEELISSWQSIDATVATYPKARVSGGIFLYPRQQQLFFTIIQRLVRSLQASYPNRSLRVCETGFGGGHSAALFLSASRNAVVVSFDKFDRPYQKPAADLLLNKYPNRFTTVAGNSCLTVPTYLSSKWDPQPFHITESGKWMTEKIQCDILHGSSLCLSDNIDLVENSPPGSLLTSTSMDSLEDKEVYFGGDAQWSKLRANGCIRDITCFAEEETGVNKKFVFSRRMQGNKMRHKFCIAIVTGKCRAANGLDESTASVESPLSRITESLNLRNLYPQFQIKPPAQGVDAVVRANLATWAANQTK